MGNAGAGEETASPPVERGELARGIYFDQKMRRLTIRETIARHEESLGEASDAEIGRLYREGKRLVEEDRKRLKAVRSRQAARKRA